MTTRVTSDKWNRGWVAVADVQRLSTWSRHWNVVSKELDVLLTSLCSVLIEIVTSSRRLSHACWLGLREATCPSDGSVARSRCCAASQDIVPPRSSRHEEVAPARSRDCRQTARLLLDVFVQHWLPRPVACSSVQTAHLKSFCCSYYCRGWCARVQFCYLRVTKNTRRAHAPRRLRCGSRVQTRIPMTDEISGDFLVQRYISGKIFTKIC